MTEDELKQALIDQANAQISRGWVCVGVPMSLPDKQIKSIWREVEREVNANQNRQNKVKE